MNETRHACIIPFQCSIVLVFHLHLLFRFYLAHDHIMHLQALGMKRHTTHKELSKAHGDSLSRKHGICRYGNSSDDELFVSTGVGDSQSLHHIPTVCRSRCMCSHARLSQYQTHAFVPFGITSSRIPINQPKPSEQPSPPQPQTSHPALRPSSESSPHHPQPPS